MLKKSLFSPAQPQRAETRPTPCCVSHRLEAHNQYVASEVEYRFPLTCYIPKSRAILPKGRFERQLLRDALTGWIRYVIPTATKRLPLPVATVRPQDIRMFGTSISTQPKLARSRVMRVVLAWAIVCFTVLMLQPTILSAKPKTNRAPRPEPEPQV